MKFTNEIEVSDFIRGKEGEVGAQSEPRWMDAAIVH